MPLSIFLPHSMKMVQVLQSVLFFPRVQASHWCTVEYKCIELPVTEDTQNIIEHHSTHLDVRNKLHLKMTNSQIVQISRLTA
jgi:hypothetical protein